MTPDKIFVTTSELTHLLSVRRHEYDVEYICKDTLLEKINKTAEIVKGIADDDYKRGCQIIIDQVTDIIKSM